MQPQEISFTIKLTSEMINAIAFKVAEIQQPTIVLKSDNKTIYTVKEVAKLVGKTNWTISKHIRIGLLVAHKTGKSYTITETNLNNYINAK